jgi:hypothetical protein
MKVGNAAPAIYEGVPPTNTPVTMITTPTPEVGINRTRLTTSIGNNIHYYPNLQYSLVITNNQYVSPIYWQKRFDANYCIIFSIILTHSHLS